MYESCCDMSITLNTKTRIKNLIIKGNNILANNIYLVLLFLVLITIFHSFLNKIVDDKKKNLLTISVLEAFIYFIGWMIMTSCMTANIYILSSVCIGKMIGVLLFGRVKTSVSCCV